MRGPGVSRLAATLAALFAAESWSGSPAATGQIPASTSEMRVPVGDASLFVRDVGRGSTQTTDAERALRRRATTHAVPEPNSSNDPGSGTGAAAFSKA